MKLGPNPNPILWDSIENVKPEGSGEVVNVGGDATSVSPSSDDRHSERFMTLHRMQHIFNEAKLHSGATASNFDTNKNIGNGI